MKYRLFKLAQYLKDQGLLSVKELWVKIHYPATARCGPACRVVWGMGEPPPATRLVILLVFSFVK